MKRNDPKAKSTEKHKLSSNTASPSSKRLNPTIFSCDGILSAKYGRKAKHYAEKMRRHVVLS